VKLLAHSSDRTQAVVTHDDGLPYAYAFGDIDTHTLINAPATHIVPKDWNVDVNLAFDTIGEVKGYLNG